MNNNEKAAIGWAIAALAFGFLFVFKNSDPSILIAGTFTKIGAALVGAVVGFVGAMIGDSIRRFTKPDAFFTTGGLGSILGTKLFWMVGPQVIGMFIGIFLGMAIVIH